MRLSKQFICGNILKAAVILIISGVEIQDTLVGLNLTESYVIVTSNGAGIVNVAIHQYCSTKKKPY